MCVCVRVSARNVAASQKEKKNIVLPIAPPMAIIVFDTGISITAFVSTASPRIFHSGIPPWSNFPVY